MSSSTYAYSDSSMLSDDTVTSPRLDASGVAPYDSDVAALNEEVNDYLTVATAEATAAAKRNRAATRVGLTVAPYSKDAEIAETKRRVEAYERALYGDECDDENEAASVSTVPKVSYRKYRKSNKNKAVGERGLNSTPAGVANVTSVYEGNEDHSRLLGNDLGSPSSRNRFIDGFMRIYQSSQGIELNHIQTRLAECQKNINVNVAPSIAADRPSLPPIVATRPVNQIQPDTQVPVYCNLCTQSSYSQPVAANKLPIRPIVAMRPVNQMQPDGTSAQAAMYCNLCAAQSSYSHVNGPEHMKYGNYPSAYNGFRPGFGPSSGMTVINPSNSASYSNGFQQQESSGYAPGFTPSYQSQQWHAPAASNYNTASSDNNSYIQGYSSNTKQVKQFVNPPQAYTYRYIYGPLTPTYIVTPFIQGSSRDGLQPSTHALTSVRPPAPLTCPPPSVRPSAPLLIHPPPTLNDNHKRPPGLGWETGRSPNRRRVVSSPGYIDSSPHSSTAPIPSSSHPSPPPLPPSTTTVPVDNNDELVDTFFTRHPDTDGTDWYCTYKCPTTGDICEALLSGVDGGRRNRFRHLARHAHSEEECVALGFLKVENTLLLNRLKKVVVKCVVRGCGFRKEVWRTDKVREEHEEEVHPDVYEQRKAKKKTKRKSE